MRQPQNGALSGVEGVFYSTDGENQGFLRKYAHQLLNHPAFSPVSVDKHQVKSEACAPVPAKTHQ